jgi:NAD(P)-dependent dehydrogenase (short-subunit alcohol dehydrogenase family)
VGSVLVTGAGRGIGRAIALSLAGAGWDVYAGVRRPEDGESLAAEAGAGRIVPVVLDVTDSEHVSALEESLPAQLDAVVNNAGIVVDGPVEAIKLDDMRHQLEVNVVGQLAVTQQVLPRLRESQGRVVFISSVSGRIATPWTGAYNASKFALEGLADALRIELRPWKIKVILVEPAATDTDLWGRALDQLDATEAAMSDEHRRLYSGHVKGMRRTTKMIQKQAVPVEHVVAAVRRALTDRRPKARYPVGAPSRIQLAMDAATPTPVMDAALATMTGVPRRVKS